MTEEFKPGDVVMLKSGGPEMTVSAKGTVPAYGDEPSKENLTCVWYAGYSTSFFDPACLKKTK